MRQAYRFVKWCLIKIVKAATEKLWNYYEDEHWLIGSIVTVGTWLAGVLVMLIIYEAGGKLLIMNILLNIWTAFWAVFIIARLGNMAWQQFIHEQNVLFEKLKERS